MEPKPVQQSRSPAYPTRREVLAGAATFALAHVAGNWRLWAATEAGVTIVAPIFEHGKGRGLTGCIVVSPPVFLSEEEAMQIVREELGKHGIQLKEAPPFRDVLIPRRIKERDAVIKADGKVERIEKTIEDPRNAKPLKPDGIDPNKRIAVSYLSEQAGDPFGQRRIPARSPNTTSRTPRHSWQTGPRDSARSGFTSVFFTIRWSL